jgi:phospholipase C
MASILDSVKTIVLVMMENRSFDHMLGHLTLDNPGLDINGLKAGSMADYSNDHNGSLFPCYERDNDNTLSFDLPHEADFVQTQLKINPVSGAYTMHGFVDAFASFTGIVPNPECDPMGYFPSILVPITDFLAKNFCVCDNWFAPIPTSTQPNRTMAFSGDSSIYQTKTQIVQIPGDVFRWMDHHGINWRVYHNGLSFFTLYSALWPYVIGEKFLNYAHFSGDMAQAPAPGDPEVIIIEPYYEDAPHIGSGHPNDNHAPLSVGWGESLLQDIYQVITANPNRWAGTLMILYYDEHGGFFDHAPPPLIPYTTIGSNPYPFLSLGPRIPGIIISPFVNSGSVCHELFDHTSVLQLLAEKFTPGSIYSQNVDARRIAGIKSIQDTLSNLAPVAPPVMPALPLNPSDTPGLPLSDPQQSQMGLAFQSASQQMQTQYPAGTAMKLASMQAVDLTTRSVTHSMASATKPKTQKGKKKPKKK